MADDRDFIEEALQESHLRFGRELSPQELAEKFIGHDLDARVFHLKNLKDEPQSVEQAAKRLGYERALHHAHEKLRKVGR